MKYLKKMLVAFVLLFSLGVEPLLVCAQEAAEISGDVTIMNDRRVGISEAKNVATRSGNLGIRPLTKTEIANLYQEIENYDSEITFDQIPNLSAPYTSGKVDAVSIAAGLKCVNMYRKIAGLPPEVEDPKWSESAQYGAALLAATNQFDHHPKKAADMDQSFYEKGYAATSSSNLSKIYGGTPFLFPFSRAISGQIEDDGDSNRTSIGHRRWLLDPYATKIGFGAARKNASLYDIKVFGDDSSSAPSYDWDFISWPASGNFPLSEFNFEQAWTITLNNDKYALGDPGKVTVRVTAPDGTVEAFSGANYHDNPKTTDKYFDISDERYGEPNCIILGFGPNCNKFIVPGSYHVEVKGLEAKSDARTVSLDYYINVFKDKDYVGRAAVTDAQYNNISQFVERMYTKILNRSSDPNGKLDWIMQLADHDATGARMTQGFVFSDEYLKKRTGDGQYLDMLYQAFFNRAPDTLGKNDWLYKLQHGLSREYVFKGFAESREFGTLCRAYGIDRGTVALSQGRDLNAGATMFVYRLYQNALGRTPDLAGLNDWAGKIARKDASAEYVATTGFFHSKEFLGKGYGNEDFVKILYRTFLGREYDAPGFADWTGKLANGMSRDEVLRGFSNSSEFHKIMSDYGL